MVYHSENPRVFISFQFYAFSIYAAIIREATSAYNESHVCNIYSHHANGNYMQTAASDIISSLLFILPE
jgi:hypothetical protein